MKKFTLAFLTVGLFAFTSKADYSYCVLDQPPSDLYFKHDNVPEYVGQTPIFEDSYLNLMQTRLDQFTNLILQNAPPKTSPRETLLLKGIEQHVWIYYGAAGRALTFFNLYNYYLNSNPSLADSYLQSAKQYIDEAIQKVRVDPMYIGFSKGHTGVYTMGSIIYDTLGDTATAETYYNIVIDQFNNLSEANEMNHNQGVAGLLLCGEYLKNHFKRDIIPRNLIVSAGELIIKVGVDFGYDNGTLIWPDETNPDANWNGEGRGSSGIMHQLFKIPELFENPTYSYHIEQTVVYWMGRQDESGQVYDYVTDEAGFDTMPYKVQWCHGSAGFIPVFAQAALVFNNQTYMDRAILAEKFTWEQGIVTKGMQLCHGVGGNAYMILYLYQVTLDPKYLYHFYAIHKFALDTPQLTDPEEMLAYDCFPYSVFVSSVGSAVVSYTDFLQYYNQDPQGMLNIKMPAFEAPLATANLRVSLFLQ